MDNDTDVVKKLPTFDDSEHEDSSFVAKTSFGDVVGEVIDVNNDPSRTWD